LNIWDFSGKYDSLRVRMEFYQELHAIIFCFDLTNQFSFNNIEFWLKECKKNSGDKLIPVLVGLKSDLTNKREVQKSDIDTVINKYKLNYYEVSGKTGDNVKKFFYEFSNFVLELLPKEKKK
jgi:GTPase SAR1 family protein